MAAGLRPSRCKLLPDENGFEASRRIGAIAQLVEHLHGMQGVRSSSLLGSIEFSPLSKGELGGKLGGFDLKQTL